MRASFGLTRPRPPALGEEDFFPLGFLVLINTRQSVKGFFYTSAVLRSVVRRAPDLAPGHMARGVSAVPANASPGARLSAPLPCLSLLAAAGQDVRAQGWLVCGDRCCCGKLTCAAYHALPYLGTARSWHGLGSVVLPTMLRGGSPIPRTSEPRGHCMPGTLAGRVVWVLGALRPVPRVTPGPHAPSPP